MDQDTQAYFDQRTVNIVADSVDLLEAAYTKLPNQNEEAKMYIVAAMHTLKSLHEMIRPESDLTMKDRPRKESFIEKAKEKASQVGRSLMP